MGQSFSVLSATHDALIPVFFLRLAFLPLAWLPLNNVLAAATPALTLAAPPTVPRLPLQIMIDPGHGGSDTGASRGNLKESEIALKVALRLADLLRHNPQFKVALTRTTDHQVPLAKRTELAEQNKADLFVSIHLNSSPDPRARGTEIYFQNQLPADEEAMFLVSRESDETSPEQDPLNPSANEPLSAHTDLKRILEDLQRNQRIGQSSELGKTLLETLIEKNTGVRFGHHSIRQAPFLVVSAIHIPSVLVELGYITNMQEGPRLAHSEYQNELAHGLYEGIVKFKETLDKEAAETLKSQQ